MAITLNRSGINDKALNIVGGGLIVFALNLADHVVFTEDGNVLAFFQKNLHKGIYEITISSSDFDKLRRAFPGILFRAVGQFDGIVLDTWNHNSLWDPNAETDYIFVENLKDIKNTNLINSVLDHKSCFNNGNFDIVLLRVCHSIGGHVQYTTHLHNKTEDSIDAGHYFEHLADAIKDFEKRS